MGDGNQLWGKTLCIRKAGHEGCMYSCISERYCIFKRVLSMERSAIVFEEEN